MSFRQAFAEKIARILAPLENKFILSSVLAVNVVLLAVWGAMFYRYISPQDKQADRMHAALSEMTTLNGQFDLALMRGQAELIDVQKPFDDIAQGMQKVLSMIRAGQHQFARFPDFIQNSNEYLSFMQARIDAAPKIGTAYRNLSRLNQLMREQFEKTLRVSDNLLLNSLLENLTRQVTDSRLMIHQQGRENIFAQIANISQRAELLPTSEQGKLYLMMQSVKEMVDQMRALDLLRQSLTIQKITPQRDVLLHTIQNIQSKQNADISLHFRLMVVVGAAIVLMQTLLAMWTLAKRHQLSFLQSEADGIIARSEAMMARARQYTQETHRTQFQMLSGFCHDFHHLTDLTNHAAHQLRLNAIGSPVQYASKNLSDSVSALEKWLNNYIFIHETGGDLIEDIQEHSMDNPLKIRDICEQLFSEVRYYGYGVDYKSGIHLADNVPEEVLVALASLDDLLRNALLISLKWMNEDGIQLNVHTTKDDDNNRLLYLTFVDTNKSVSNDLRQKYIQLEDSQQSWDGLDRFVIMALACCRRLLAPAKGRVHLQEINGLLCLQLFLPFRLEKDNEVVDKSLDTTLDVQEEENLLFKKRILVVSPYQHTRETLQAQLTSFSATSFVIVDKYAAIGQILDQVDNLERCFHAVLFEHSPPEIDAVELVTKLRSVMPDHPLPVILMSSQNNFDSVSGKNPQLYEKVLLKPVLPSELKLALSEAFGEKKPAVLEEDITDFSSLDQSEPLKDLRVLIYESDDLQQIIIEASLQEKGYIVTVANSETEALTLVGDRPFDVLLLTENLRDYTINAFMSIVRDEDCINRLMAVIILTSSQMTDREMRRTKTDDTLITPINRTALIEKVKEWGDPTARRASGEKTWLRTG